MVGGVRWKAGAGTVWLEAEAATPRDRLDGTM